MGVSSKRYHLVIGLLKEIKDSEFRVGLTEKGVAQLVKDGHRLIVERSAGSGAGISDKDYLDAGAELVSSAEEVYARSILLIKVKEPLEEEYKFFRENQIIFTFLHLAAEPQLTEALCQSGASALAYETIEDKSGALPLLSPMSQVAGRLAVQNAMYYLQKFTGGKGLLAGGVDGAEKAQVTVLGGGIAGLHAGQMALGMEADLTVLDINEQRLQSLSELLGGKAQLKLSQEENILSALQKTDVFIGSVLLKGHRAPKLISRKMLQAIPEKSVVVDISIDQGGCIETARPTSHREPVYTVDGVIHYCVPNIPSAVSRTSTYALSQVSLPYIRQVAHQGLKKALKEDPGFKKGLNVYRGSITCLPVAEALNRAFRSPEELDF